jgi:hypothetical protein
MVLVLMCCDVDGVGGVDVLMLMVSMFSAFCILPSAQAYLTGEGLKAEFFSLANKINLNKQCTFSVLLLSE